MRVTTAALPAVRTLSDGRKTFFNQLIAAFRGWSDSRNDPNKAITFGGGEPITNEDMAPAIALADELTEDCAWQPGDVALVDNFTVMHGRRPFEGSAGFWLRWWPEQSAYHTAPLVITSAPISGANHTLHPPATPSGENSR